MTIKDIARLSGYSLGTVSRVLNNHPDVSQAARERLDMDFIQSAAAAIILGAAIGMMFLRNSFRVPVGGMWACYGALLAAGAGNFLMLSWMRHAMAIGNNGAVWGIVQSAMICPFVMGMVFFGVAPEWNRLSGLGLVLAGIFLLSRATPAGTVSGRRWLLPAFVGCRGRALPTRPR